MKILVVDDHPLIREGLGHVLVELDGGAQVLEADSAQPALDAARANGDLGLILLDLMLPGEDGLSLLERFRSERPEVPVVVLSGNDDRATILEAIDRGAMGFISKRSPTSVMVSALRLVLVGGVYIPPQALGGAAPRPAPLQPEAGRGTTPADLGLTEREVDVLTLLVQGKPNKLICRDLGLAESTVKAHISAILRALNVSNRTEALFALSRLGVRLPTERSRPVKQVAPLGQAQTK